MSLNYAHSSINIQNLMEIIAKSLTVSGFFIYRIIHKYLDEFHATVPEKLASGEIKYTEEVVKGLDKVGDVVLAIQNGTIKAKAVISVADE